MRKVAEVKLELRQLLTEKKADSEEDYDSKLPCCDYRELITRISVLEWVLGGKNGS
jgi:hypothetical protein